MAAAYPKGTSGFAGRHHDDEVRRRISERRQAQEWARRSARDREKNAALYAKVEGEEVRRIVISGLEKLRQADPEIADRLLAIVRDPEHPQHFAALREAGDRVWGKPVSPTVALTVKAGELSDDQAAALLEKMTGAKLTRRPGNEPGEQTFQLTADAGKFDD